MSAFGTTRTFQSLAVSPVSLWHTASLQLPCRPAASRPPWSVAYAYEMRCERSPAPMSPRRFPPSRKRNLALVNTQEKGRFGGLSFWGLERPHILTRDRPKRLKHIEAGERPKPKYGRKLPNRDSNQIRRARRVLVFKCSGQGWVTTPSPESPWPLS